MCVNPNTVENVGQTLTYSDSPGTGAAEVGVQDGLWKNNMKVENHGKLVNLRYGI